MSLLEGIQLTVTLQKSLVVVIFVVSAASVHQLAQKTLEAVQCYGRWFMTAGDILGLRLEFLGNRENVPFPFSSK